MLVSNLIRQLKAAGIWTSLDRLWLFAAENATQALTDLKARSVATAVNSPTFTANRGYAGNGTTSYINSNYVASTDAVNYALNSASLFFYANTNRADADLTAMGALYGASLQAAMGLRFGGNALGLLHNTTASIASGGVSDALGLTTISRTASNLTTVYRRGSALGTTAGVASAVPTVALYVLGLNNGDSVANAETARGAVAGIAAGLSAAQVAALNTAVEAYLTAIGGNA